jgi:hypothetical protein
MELKMLLVKSTSKKGILSKEPNYIVTANSKGITAG